MSFLISMFIIMSVSQPKGCYSVFKRQFVHMWWRYRLVHELEVRALSLFLVSRYSRSRGNGSKYLCEGEMKEISKYDFEEDFDYVLLVLSYPLSHLILSYLLLSLLTSSHFISFCLILSQSNGNTAHLSLYTTLTTLSPLFSSTSSTVSCSNNEEIAKLSNILNTILQSGIRCD